MHFKASFAYAALANLLEEKGFNTEDTAIAMEMKLPYLFAKVNGYYLSGPMLQTAQWFNLYLNPHGFTMTEEAVAPSELCRYLQESDGAMLGMSTPTGRHTVVYTGYDDTYQFTNPAYENDGAASRFACEGDDLAGQFHQPVIVATLRKTAPQTVALRPYLEASIPALRENVKEITAFCGAPHTPDQYNLMMNTLFRPLLLDGITMLSLIGETKLSNGLLELQNILMKFMVGPKKGALRSVLPLPKLQKYSEQYVSLISAQIRRL